MIHSRLFRLCALTARPSPFQSYILPSVHGEGRGGA